VRAGEVKDQLDRASTSIPLNIAEGNGKVRAEGSAAASLTSRMVPRWSVRPAWMFWWPRES